MCEWTSPSLCGIMLEARTNDDDDETRLKSTLLPWSIKPVFCLCFLWPSILFFFLSVSSPPYSPGLSATCLCIPCSFSPPSLSLSLTPLPTCPNHHYTSFRHFISSHHLLGPLENANQFAAVLMLKGTMLLIRCRINADKPLFKIK